MQVPGKFQSPEGDSGLCYTATATPEESDHPGFSPPKGIQVFVTYENSICRKETASSFSPPKGIQVFVTFPGQLRL